MISEIYLTNILHVVCEREVQCTLQALLNFKDYRMFRQLVTLNVSKIHIGSLGVRQLSIACKSLTSLNLSGKKGHQNY